MTIGDRRPESIDEIANLSVDLPLLADNTQESCPVSMDDVLDYLSLEDPSGEEDGRRELTFIRTAQVKESHFWIWRYHDDDGIEWLVTVQEMPDGSTTVGMNGNVPPLTPELFILSMY